MTQLLMVLKTSSFFVYFPERMLKFPNPTRHITHWCLLQTAYEACYSVKTLTSIELLWSIKTLTGAFVVLSCCWYFSNGHCLCAGWNRCCMLHHHLAISHSDHLLTFCNLVLPSVSSKAFLCSLICDLKNCTVSKKLFLYSLDMSLQKCRMFRNCVQYMV